MIDDDPSVDLLRERVAFMPEIREQRRLGRDDRLGTRRLARTQR
jgi:hypothetical protein